MSRPFSGPLKGSRRRFLPVPKPGVQATVEVDALEGRKEAVGAETASRTESLQHLREANERLVVASMKAHTLSEAADQASVRLREANESLVIATIQAQTMAEIAQQATAQMAYRAKLEAQLLEAQKLEALGILASGVAHDFNNLLATIVGHADMGTLATEPGSKAARCFKAIDKAAMKASELTRQLLAYTGKGKVKVVAMDLALVVKEITQLLSVSMPKKVLLTCHMEDRLPFVKGDPTQIFQVLMNLVTNAAEAFPPGGEGRITIQAHAEKVEAATPLASPWVLPLTPGRYASLEVTDTGSGMTPEVLARVFEPFFSTKITGRGLGLAAVVGILRSHGGGLRVTSEPGHGSSFKLFLPAMQEVRPFPAMEYLPAWHGEGTVLIVDAQKAPRQLARHLAEGLGFSVLEACDGPEGIHSFLLHHETLALVLVDFDLPNLGGQDAFRAMREIDCKVPVVLTTGYGVPDARLALEGMAGVLKNPYRVAEFRSLLQHAGRQEPPVPAI
jgi:signal transduction histidine kinase/CheY-like chemotaxis protein